MSDNDSFEFGKSVNEQAIVASNIVLRTLIFIHGGAAIALLAFIGNVAGNESLNLNGKISGLSQPLIWFGWGVALTVIAMSSAYFTHYLTVGHSFAEAGSRSEKWFGCWKTGCHILAVFSALGSLTLFLYGMYEVRFAIMTILR